MPLGSEEARKEPLGQAAGGARLWLVGRPGDLGLRLYREAPPSWPKWVCGRGEREGRKACAGRQACALDCVWLCDVRKAQGVQVDILCVSACPRACITALAATPFAPPPSFPQLRNPTRPNTPQHYHRQA